MGGPLKSGKNPSVAPKNGSTDLRSQGTSTNRPHRPYTTLGIAARVSIRNDTTGRSRAGAISTRNTAMPTETGSAITIASTLVTRVP